MKNTYYLLKQFSFLFALILLLTSFQGLYDKQLYHIIIDICLISLFDAYSHIRNSNIKNLKQNENFLRFFDNEFKEIIKTKYNYRTFTFGGFQNDLSNQNSQKTNVFKNYQDDSYYEIFQIAEQSTFSSFKDITTQNYKKTYRILTIFELLQIYKQESQQPSYILFYNQQSIYKVIITKKILYEIEYIKLDSVLYKKIKGNKNKYRLNLQQIFSHKLKTPLNSAIGTITQLLIEPNLTKQHQLLLSQVYNSLKTQLFSVSDFIDYVNIEQHGLYISKISLIQLLSNVKEMVRIQCKAKNIKLLMNINDKPLKECSEQIYLSTDVLKLERILYNLLNNAYRFSISNGIIILNANIQNGELKIQIKDNGFGMQSEMIIDYNLQLKQILKQENTIKKSWSNKLGPTLLVANKLIYLLSGYKYSLIIFEPSIFSFTILIELQSTKACPEFGIASSYSGKSEFNFQNYEDHISEDESIIQEPHSQLVKERISKIKKIPSRNQSIFNQSRHSQQLYYQRQSSVFDINSFLKQFSFKDNNDLDIVTLEKDQYIMIVDDEPFNHDTLLMMLKRIGYQLFLHAYNGQECIQQIEIYHKKIKLVLMDLDMPILDGIKSTTERLKIMMNQNIITRLSIVACTAHDDIETQEQCYKAGMMDIIIKPVFIKQLQTVIKNIPQKLDGSKGSKGSKK